MKKTFLKFATISSAALGLIIAASAAQAVTITAGNIPQAGDANVIFQACDPAAAQADGLTVEGCLNTSPTTFVEFTGLESLHVNGGQARVEAVDGSFTQLTIGFDDATSSLTSLILNVFTDSLDPTGQVQFIIDFFGPTADFTSSSFFVANGQNFFTIVAGTSELIDTVTVISSIGLNAVLFDDVRQVRIGGPLNGNGGGGPGAVVPEPSSLALIGAAIAAMGFLRRRRRD